jgi:hypothetical protein
VIAAVGVAFLGAGAAWFFRRWPGVGRSCAVAVASGLGVAFIWAAFTAQDPKLVAGGFPLLGAAATRIVARVLAGLAAAVCFLMAAAVVRRAVTRSPRG